MKHVVTRVCLASYRAVLPLILSFTLAACSYPFVQASTVDTRPHLSVAGAQNGAILIVDGVTLGPASDYTPDKKLLTLAPGTHHVVVSNGSTMIFDNSVYLGDGTDRVISLPQ